MKKRYNLMLSPAVIWRVDNYAECNGLSRSTAINNILAEFLVTSGYFVENTAPINDEQILLSDIIDKEGDIYDI